MKKRKGDEGAPSPAAARGGEGEGEGKEEKKAPLWPTHPTLISIEHMKQIRIGKIVNVGLSSCTHPDMKVPAELTADYKCIMCPLSVKVYGCAFGGREETFAEQLERTKHISRWGVGLLPLDDDVLHKAIVASISACETVLGRHVSAFRHPGYRPYCKHPLLADDDGTTHNYQSCPECQLRVITRPFEKETAEQMKTRHDASARRWRRVHLQIDAHVQLCSTSVLRFAGRLPQFHKVANVIDLGDDPRCPHALSIVPGSRHFACELCGVHVVCSAPADDQATFMQLAMRALTEACASRAASRKSWREREATDMRLEKEKAEKEWAPVSRALAAVERDHHARIIRVMDGLMLLGCTHIEMKQRDVRGYKCAACTLHFDANPADDLVHETDEQQDARLKLVWAGWEKARAKLIQA